MRMCLRPTASLLETSARTFDYLFYGLRIRADIELSVSSVSRQGFADLDILRGDSALFSSALAEVTLDPDDWYHAHELSNGFSYIRCERMFEFLVPSDGSSILYRMLGDVTVESFQTYA